MDDNKTQGTSPELRFVSMDCLCRFVAAARASLTAAAIIVVQSEYDGLMECRLFDLGVDDIVTLDYSPPLLAARTALRTKNRRMR